MPAITDLFLTFATIPAPTEIAPAARSYWMPEQASTVASNVDFVFNVITWISIFFFVLITALLVYFVVKYRRVEGHAPKESPTHHTTLELTWTIIPLILVIVIFYYGMQGYIVLATPPVDSYEINVTARKWSWEFEHRNGCREVGTLRVPVNRPVRLIMTSDDVLHALFIPAFRVKQDVVPGRFTQLWFTATRTGEFDLYCAEYCGTEHSQMLARVIVYEEDEFHEALRECAEWFDRVPGERLHLAAARLFMSRCAQCHTLDGTDLTGPSFLETHQLFQAGGTRRFADGRTRVVDENYIIESIEVPGRDIVEGFRNVMPPMPLTAQQRQGFIQFFRRLDEIELDARGRPIVPEIADLQADEQEGETP